MKSLLKFTGLFLVLIFLNSNKVFSEDQKSNEIPKIAFVEFGSVGVSKDIAQAISKNILFGFENSELFTVVNYSALEDLITAQQKDSNIVKDLDFLKELKAKFGADYLFSGKIIAFGSAFNISYELIDTETGVISKADIIKNLSLEQIAGVIVKQLPMLVAGKQNFILYDTKQLTSRSEPEVFCSALVKGDYVYMVYTRYVTDQALGKEKQIGFVRVFDKSFNYVKEIQIASDVWGSPMSIVYDDTYFYVFYETSGEEKAYVNKYNQDFQFISKYDLGEAYLGHPSQRGIDDVGFLNEKFICLTKDEDIYSKRYTTPLYPKLYFVIRDQNFRQINTLPIASVNEENRYHCFWGNIAQHQGKLYVAYAYPSEPEKDEESYEGAPVDMFVNIYDDNLKVEKKIKLTKYSGSYRIYNLVEFDGMFYLFYRKDDENYLEIWEGDFDNLKKIVKFPDEIRSPYEEHIALFVVYEWDKCYVFYNTTKGAWLDDIYVKIIGF